MQKQQRTGLSTILITALLVVLVHAAGCGGNEGRAGGFVENGDAALAVLESGGGAVQERVDLLFNEAGAAMAAGGAPDASSFTGSAKEIVSDIGALRKEAGRAVAGFERARSVDGAGLYGKYAAVRLELIETYLEGLELLESFLDSASALVTAGEFDGSGFLQAADGFSSRAEELAAGANALEEEASEIKSDMKPRRDPR